MLHWYLIRPLACTAQCQVAAVIGFSVSEAALRGTQVEAVHWVLMCMSKINVDSNQHHPN
jgi:hypothetical protein